MTTASVLHGIFVTDREPADSCLTNPSPTGPREITIADRDGNQYVARLVGTGTYSDCVLRLRTWIDAGKTPDGQPVPYQGHTILKLAKRPNSRSLISLAD